MSPTAGAARLRELLTEALDLSQYVAAPFFSEAVRRREDESGEVTYIQPTTEEWWDGLREAILAIQPKLTAALSPIETTAGVPISDEQSTPLAERIEAGIANLSNPDTSDIDPALLARVEAALAQPPAPEQPAEPEDDWQSVAAETMGYGAEQPAAPMCPQCGGNDVLAEPRTQLTCRACRDVFLSEVVTEQPALPCGHSASLLLRSAETGEPLYCELCDDKSGRRA